MLIKHRKEIPKNNKSHNFGQGVFLLVSMNSLHTKIINFFLLLYWNFLPLVSIRPPQNRI